MEKVAIVFSSYNSSEYIGNCLESCITQSHSETYVIIADDGSTDDTVKILKSYAENNKKLFIIPLPHGERGIARSAAISKASEINADYIYIIDSDMILEKTLVSDCLDFFNKNKNVGALVIPEKAFSNYKNFYSKVKVFERNILNNAGEDLGKNSIEAARFWKFSEYQKTGGINIHQISFEETQPTIRYTEAGGIIKRAIFTFVLHDEKYVTLNNLLKKKRYYFSVMNKTIESESKGTGKAFSRWYFFRPVLYRKVNLLSYLKHPLLTIGMIWMYLVLTFIGGIEIIKSKINSGGK